MKQHKALGILSVGILAPVLLYIAGIIAQFMINVNAWKAAGSDYRVSPGLPSLNPLISLRALIHFPEGLIAIGIVLVGVAVLCIFGLRLGWGNSGITDRERNFTVSSSGSYGTAAFMSDREAANCFEITTASKATMDILGTLNG